MPSRPSRRLAPVALALAAMAGASGCFSGASHPSNPIRPVIRTFTASPQTATAGAEVTLAWTVRGADTISIDNGVGVVTGASVVVRPLATTTYTLTATNAAGPSTASVTVTVPVQPPATLVYAVNPAAYVQGVAIHPNLPSTTGGVPTTYAVSPALPAGLSLSTSTGIITGTPTAVSATRNHVVTASNSAGSTTATLSITVVPPQPPGLPIIASFTATPSDVLVGGSATLAWIVVDATSLSISPDVGDVTGITSTTVQPATTTLYTLTATNGAGSITASVTLNVTDRPPTGLTYATNPASYTLNTPIADNVPTVTGGPATSFAVTPELPLGLVLDAVTGVISGTPTSVTPAATYTVQATNAAGSVTASVQIAVVAGPPPVITQQPTDQAVVPPATATFGVTATGNGTLSYQWQRDGTDIPGATSSTYTTPATTGADTGALFRVVVSDAFGGSVTSTTARLSVEGFSYTGAMASARLFHTATLLADGRVLVTGGSTGSATLASAEVWDPATGVFTATGGMGTARQNHAAVLLADGKVLVAGGLNSQSFYLATAEVWDPSTGVFTPTNGNMLGRRMNFVASRLADGTVLVAGGFRQDGGGTQPIDVYLATAEIYDPVAGTFSATGSMTAAREFASAVALASGRVLVAGGFNPTGGYLASAELYDPAGRSFAATGSMTTGRDSFPVAVLAGGAVLATGGRRPTSLATCDLYDPLAGTFAATGSMSVSRALETATTLPDGTVLVAGGTDGAAVLGTAELYDPVAGTFSAAPPLNTPRYGHVAVPVAGGHVLVVGGQGASSVLSTVELWTSVP
jgi:hypothetical protein